jgi:hypothetical protein
LLILISILVFVNPVSAMDWKAVNYSNPDLIKESGCEITRINAKGMSIKLPDSKKAHRFKGSIYDEQFKSIEDFGQLSKEAEQRHEDFSSRDKSRELEQTIKRLDEYNEQKAQHNREKYQLKDDRYKRTEQEPIQSKDLDNINQREPDNRTFNRDNINGLHTKISRVDRVASTKRDETPRREHEIHTKQKPNIQSRQDDNIHQDRGVDYDTRRRTLERVRERTEQQQQAYTKARQARAELYGTITEQSKELRAELEQNSIELSKEYEPIVRTARATIEQSSNHIEAVESIERATTTRELINIGVQQFIDKVREFGAGLKQRFGQLVQESGDISRTAKENLDNKEQREQSYNTPSYGMRM